MLFPTGDSSHNYGLETSHNYLKTCFAQGRPVLAIPLLAWLLKFVEVGLQNWNLGQCIHYM